MEKIIIIGSKGMAGHVLYYYLRESGDYEVLDISRTNNYFNSTYLLDVTNYKVLGEIIKDELPDYVINCVGVLNKQADERPDTAILLNSFLPHYLAKKATEAGSKLIQISTDCVFSGKRGNYDKNDLKDGTGYYAQSKALGEVVYGDHTTLRTSIIGPELKQNGIGLFDWFMKSKGVIKGYTGAIWTGVTSLALAKAITTVMQKKIHGLHHVVNGYSINKYELLLLFKKYFGKNMVAIEPFDNYTVNKSLSLSEVDFEPGSYEQMIIEMKEWIIKHQFIYPEYYR